MNKSTEGYIIDDQEAGLFRVNRRVFTDPECLERSGGATARRGKAETTKSYSIQ